MLNRVRDPGPRRRPRVRRRGRLPRRPASAQTGSELLLKPFPKELRYDNQTDISFADDAHAKNIPGTDFQLSTFDTEGRIRLNPGDVASPRFGYAFKYLGLDSNIPGLPDRLVDMSVGFATPIGKIDPWVIAVQGSVGYAGDSFFGDGNAYYWRGSIVGVNQLSETDALIIGIDYDRNRTYKPDVPLPGFAYVKRIEEHLLLTAGVPVTSIEWEPVEHLRVEVSYLLLDNFGTAPGTRSPRGWRSTAASASGAKDTSWTGWGPATRGSCSSRSGPRSASPTG